MPVDSEVKLLRDLAKLRVDNSRLRGQNNKLAAHGAGFDVFLDELKKITEAEKKLKLLKSPIKSEVKLKQKHSESVCLAISDIHLGEDVSCAATLGTGGYNLITAAKRMAYHSSTVKSIIKIHQDMYKLDKIYVFLLGDCINGSIHNANLTNLISDQAQAILCTRLLTIFFTELASLGIPVEILTAVGNHPRMTNQMPIKKQNYTNLDWLVYEFLLDALKFNNNINMTITPSEIGVKYIYNHRYVYSHGINVSSKKEHEFENSLRNMMDNPFFRKQSGNSGPAFDQIVIGNTHVPKLLERMIVNGSYVGNSELGISWRLPPNSPQQLIWGVSKNHSRTWSYFLDLIEGDQTMDDNPMVKYTDFFIKQYNA